MSLKFHASLSRFVTNYLRRLGMLEPPPEDLPGLWFDHRRPSIRQLTSVHLYKQSLSEHIDADGKNSYMRCFLYRSPRVCASGAQAFACHFIACTGYLSCIPSVEFGRCEDVALAFKPMDAIHLGYFEDEMLGNV
jgi:hypothetical protein